MAALAPARLAQQPKCVRAWVEGGHTLVGVGSGYYSFSDTFRADTVYLAPPLLRLAARAGTGLIHPRPGSGAAECRSPAPASDPQPMPGAGTRSSTPDLGPPGFQCESVAATCPGPTWAPVHRRVPGWAGWEESKYIPPNPKS